MFGGRPLSLNVPSPERLRPNTLPSRNDSNVSLSGLEELTAKCDKELSLDKQVLDVVKGRPRIDGLC